jgi:hypothetical protein
MGTSCGQQSDDLTSPVLDGNWPVSEARALENERSYLRNRSFRSCLPNRTFKRDLESAESERCRLCQLPVDSDRTVQPLVDWSDGALFLQEWKVALWVRF